MRVVAVLVFVCVGLVGSGCTKRNPAACCTSAEDCEAAGLPVGSGCDDGLTCVFGTCILATCSNDGDCPAEVPSCKQGQCVECLDSSTCGDQICNDSFQCAACTSDEECAEGFCIEGSCRTSIVPKFTPTACDMPAAGELELSSFDTNIDGILCDVILPQVDGPDVCVIRANTISIPPASMVKVTGSRALALVADQDVVVDGILDLSADAITDGPGGFVISGGAATATLGGGGAGGTSGGGAGGSTSDGGAANGGAITPNPATLDVLKGGARSGGSGGGGGGGALTLIACRGVVRVTGLIDVGGGGGAGGEGNDLVPVEGGSGGGAGGFVAIQSATIVISGQVFSNGGGGGGGAFLSQTNPRRGGRGEDGSRSSTEAAGGGVGSGGGGNTDGGNGGVGMTSPGQGRASQPVSGNPFPSGHGPSGGGGSVGYLQAFMPAGRTADLSSSDVSPAFGLTAGLETK